VSEAESARSDEVDWLDVLELALPESYPLELVPVVTAWGPSETTLCLDGGSVLGQLSSAPFGGPHRSGSR
jgi:hypothetical protein